MQKFAGPDRQTRQGTPKLLDTMFSGLWASAAPYWDILYNRLFKIILSIIELNVVPDFLIRRGIRSLLAKRLQEVSIISRKIEEN